MRRSLRGESVRKSYYSSIALLGNRNCDSRCSLSISRAPGVDFLFTTGSNLSHSDCVFELACVLDTVIDTEPAEVAGTSRCFRRASRTLRLSLETIIDKSER